MIDWHRLFGLAVLDYFLDSPWAVELERDMSVIQQFLDVLIVRRRAGEIHGPLPDGLDNLAEHNLLTYKSMHEALDDWALKELTHHYVSYRKLISPKEGLVTESLIRLYGVSTRFPEKLSREATLAEIQRGVYQVRRGTDEIRIIVLSEIPPAEHNALWHLFSGRAELVQFGAEQYVERSPEIKGIIDRLYGAYQLEGITMPYTLENFRHDYVLEHLRELPADECLNQFSPEERLKGLPAEERLKGLPAEERLKGLPAEERLKGLPPEELLKCFRPETIEAYLQQVRKEKNGNGEKSAGH